MKYDLLIYNARIVTEDEVILGYLCVSDGKIAAIGRGISDHEAVRSVDAVSFTLKAPG